MNRRIKRARQRKHNVYVAKMINVIVYKVVRKVFLKVEMQIAKLVKGTPISNHNSH
jgi:hypothetical protein